MCTSVGTAYTLISHVAAGKAVISGEIEVVYEEPDLSQLEPNKDIKLEECPAYGIEKKGQDIELKKCPAYGTAKKNPDIELEVCPAYGTATKDQDIEVEECPAYERTTDIELENCLA